MDDDRDSYEPDFGDELVEIPDLDYVADQMRRQAVVEYNELYKTDGINFKTEGFKNPFKLSKKKLESVIEMTLVLEIIKEILPYNKKTKNYSCNITLFWKCINKISKNIFYNIANKLVDAGIYEMIFDSETNDFAWRITPAFRQKMIDEEKDKKPPKSE
jgi:hypothetical protein